MSLMRFRFRESFSVVAAITAVAVTGCASSTVLQSQPPGAHVFLNGNPVGVTPYTMTDTNIVGTTTQLRLEYPGYQTINTYIVRNEELDPVALITGILVWVPLLWVLRYQPTHYFAMQPEGGPVPGGYPPGYPPPGGVWTPPPAPPQDYQQQPQQPQAPQQQPPAGYPQGPAGYPPPPAGYPPPAQP